MAIDPRRRDERTEAEQAADAASTQGVMSISSERVRTISEGLQRGYSDRTIQQRLARMEGLYTGTACVTPMASKNIPFAKNSFGAQPAGQKGLKAGWEDQLDFNSGTFRMHGAASFKDWVGQQRAEEARLQTPGERWSWVRDTGLGYTPPKKTGSVGTPAGGELFPDATQPNYGQPDVGWTDPTDDAFGQAMSIYEGAGAGNQLLKKAAVNALASSYANGWEKGRSINV